MLRDERRGEPVEKGTSLGHARIIDRLDERDLNCGGWLRELCRAAANGSGQADVAASYSGSMAGPDQSPRAGNRPRPVFEGSVPSRRSRASNRFTAAVSRPARSLTPFQRLARTHALMAAGEAVMAIALAGSLFLSISPAAARGKVLLFLAVSVAPFAVVAPLIGPAIDRMAGGRRLVVQIAALGRAIVGALMIVNLDSLLLFPLAFAAMVLQKTYIVSKSALVPTVVADEEELVEANSKLGVISGVVGFVAAVPAGILQLISARLTLAFDALIFLTALLAAAQLPREVVAAQRQQASEREDLRSTSILLAASAMGFMRAAVGFLFFHLAFWLRGQSAGTVWFGLGVTLAAVGSMIGNVLGPRVRRSLREEVMLTSALAFTAAAGAMAAIVGGLLSALLLMGAVNMGAAIGRLAFDSIVQRSAPDANQGRAFAQFETKFQLAWVMAGIVPVLIHIPGPLGFAIVGGLAAFAVVTYLISSRRISQGRPLPTTLRRRARDEIVRRRDQRREATPPKGAARQPRALPKGRQGDPGGRRSADLPAPAPGPFDQPPSPFNRPPARRPDH